MTTIPTRLDANALDILKRYSPGSASESIRVMDNIIKTYKECQMGEKPPQEQKANLFQTATAFKKIGNITKEEELQEPRGFGGKKV